MAKKSAVRTSGRFPSDITPTERVAQIIRVNHAGEYGATRIYRGQLAVLKRTTSGPAIAHMAAQEEEHLEAFSALIRERRVRPTALLPVWHIAGFMLGAGTALLGEKAAMACTVAVEEVIDEHYARQLGELGNEEKALAGNIKKFREEELEHRDTALAHHAKEAPAYPLLSLGIKGASKLAIWLSTRI